MARLHRLPTEVQARICEFIGNIADAPSDYQPDPRRHGDFFPEYSRLSFEYSPIYKDLRSLALTSKAFTDSAQRVLFRIAVVKGPRRIMRLLKSLLLYPKNRRHIRSLFVARYTYTDTLADHDVDLLGDFSRELRPLVLTREIDELYDASFFRGFEACISLGKSYNAYGWDNHSNGFFMGFMFSFEDHVLRAIIQLSPFLSGFHICCGEHSSSLRIPVPSSLDECTSNTFPQLKSLTLNYNALHDRVDLIAARPRYLYPVGCPPNIERLTLTGYWGYEEDYGVLSLNFIHSWIRSNTSLKELRVVRGFDDRLGAFYEDSTTRKRNENWNTILPLFKDSLETLVFDGYQGVHEDSEDRFGPTRMLSCLGDFEKLAYLKVPLHMLRQDSSNLCLPKGRQQILDLVQAKLPKGLKKVDIVMFGKPELSKDSDEWEQKWITPFHTFQVRL